MRVLIAVAILLAMAPVFGASFEAGMTAYENQDYATAFREFSGAAEAGSPAAQYMLARLYLRGSGVLQDFVQAHKWYNLAAMQGHKQARDSRTGISELMTPQQLAEAQSLANEWLAARQPDAQGEETVAGSVAEEPSEGLVGRIQMLLKRLGYNAGPINGQLSHQTRSAISDYQMANLLPVDGQASEALLEHMIGGGRPLIARGMQAPQDKPDGQWRRLLLRDSFADGNFTANPPWTVAAGRFWLESRVGLRSSALYSKARADQPKYAEIFVNQPINNAFSIKLSVFSHQKRGLLEFGPYRGQSRSVGYRLFYAAEQPGKFGLRRLTKAGATVHVSKRHFRLEDGNSHVILWTRNKAGTMLVTINGNEVLRLTDRGLKGSFEGFTLINSGGDYSVREISIHGSG